MIPLNYHQLYYFWTIAKAGSMRAAGDRLLLAVSTLSAQLSQLERQLGLRLLERGRRGVSLTPRGREIYEHCERIFTEGEALLTAARRGARPEAPSLRLGVQDSISAGIVLRLVDFVASVAPQARVTVLGGPQESMEARLREHGLDVVVANNDYTASLGRDFASRLVARLPISFVCAPALKRRVRRFPRDLGDIPLLTRAAGNPIRRTLDAYLREHRVRPRMEIEIDNPLLIRQFALQGRGAAIIDTLTINGDLKARRLVKLHPGPTRMEEYVWLLYNARPRSEPALSAVMSALARDFTIEL